MICGCGADIPDRRAALGYDLCLACGEAEAQAEKDRKAQSVVPLHRSNYVYVGGPRARQNVLDASRMRRGEG